MPRQRRVYIPTSPVSPAPGFAYPSRARRRWAGAGCCVLLGLLSLLLPLRAWAGYAEGLAAYNRGDPTTALQEWLPLAQAGHADAQYNLAVLYGNGWGVPQDAAQAVLWFRRAADQGNPAAQASLGQVYEQGVGVPQDDQQACFWYTLAAAAAAGSHGLGQFLQAEVIRHRDRVAAHLTPAQLAQAQAQARTWQPKPETSNAPPAH